jgi:mono/diheme cytochrome c family protein
MMAKRRLPSRLTTLRAPGAILMASLWALSASAPAQQHTKPWVILDYLDPLTVQAGSAIYADDCAVCHGRNLEGQPNWRRRDASGYLPAPPHDETGHTWHHSDQVLFEMVTYGPKVVAGEDYKTRMPAYQGILSDPEILAVLSFIKSKWPERIIKTHNEQANRSE